MRKKNVPMTNESWIPKKNVQTKNRWPSKQRICHSWCKWKSLQWDGCNRHHPYHSSKASQFLGDGLESLDRGVFLGNRGSSWRQLNLCRRRLLDNREGFGCTPEGVGREQRYSPTRSWGNTLPSARAGPVGHSILPSNNYSRFHACHGVLPRMPENNLQLPCGWGAFREPQSKIPRDILPAKFSISLRMPRIGKQCGEEASETDRLPRGPSYSRVPCYFCFFRALFFGWKPAEDFEKEKKGLIVCLPGQTYPRMICWGVTP